MDGRNPSRPLTPPPLIPRRRPAHSLSPQAEADDAAQRLRDARMPSVESLTRSSYASELVRLTSAPGLWTAPASGKAATVAPAGVKSNRLARQLAAAAALLGEIKGSSDGEAGAVELVSAAAKLLPKLIAALAPAPGAAAAAAAAAPPVDGLVIAMVWPLLVATIAKGAADSLSQGGEEVRDAAGKLLPSLVEAARPLLLARATAADLARRTPEEVRSRGAA